MFNFEMSDIFTLFNNATFLKGFIFGCFISFGASFFLHRYRVNDLKEDLKEARKELKEQKAELKNEINELKTSLNAHKTFIALKKHIDT